MQMMEKRQLERRRRKQRQENSKKMKRMMREVRMKVRTLKNGEAKTMMRGGMMMMWMTTKRRLLREPLLRAWIRKKRFDFIPEGHH